MAPYPGRQFKFIEHRAHNLGDIRDETSIIRYSSACNAGYRGNHS